MGDVLRHSARRSYREILDVRAVDDTRMARIYTLVFDSIAAILMTEVFNTRWFSVVRRAVFPSDVFDRRH